jgi:FAD/FMN-containing dehydrogenase
LTKAQVIKTLEGGTATIPQEAIETLERSLRGRLLQPDSSGYDEARSIWNAMIDRKPGLIVQCAGAADVIKTVNFARSNQALVSVRGVGHNIAGSAVCEGGLMIDLSKMKSVRVDPKNRKARVEPGVSLGEFDNEAQSFGLATPVGINSTTGIGGLTVGGGFGWLSRKYGLTADNLLSADVITADGELRLADQSRESDLFWGIRGGGGNFGIVTSFEFAMHPVGPQVLAGLIVHPFADAGKVLRYYRDFAAKAPDELTVWAVMRKAPPLPFLPQNVHGTEVLVLAALYAGDIAAGEKALRPLRSFGNPIADVIGPAPYSGFQSAFDPLLTPGFRNYWKSHDFRELTDQALDTMIGFIPSLPTPHCEVFIAQMGGATNRVAADATAYRHRDANFIMNVHGRWENASDDDRVIRWSRDLFDKMASFATGGVYVNFMTAEEEPRVRAAYGASYDRLVALKRKYDPTNMFRLNQNIRPAE